MKNERRIVGQCSHADFKSLERLSDLLASGEEIDLTTLSQTQKTAIWVLKHVQEKQLPFNLLLVVREVLIWGEGDKMIDLEYRFSRNPELAGDIAKFKSIMSK